MLNALLPKGAPFFELLLQQNSILSTIAVRLTDLLENNTTRGDSHKEIITSVEEAERIYISVVRHLSQTFITPIDREDILRINRVQSEAIALVYNLANRLYIFEFSVIRFPMIQLARTLKDMTVLTETMLEGLSKKRDSHNSRMFRALRADCEMILSMAIVELYDLDDPTVPDIMGILKWSQAYDRAEIALAQVTKLAETIEEAVLKHV